MQRLRWFAVAAVIPVLSAPALAAKPNPHADIECTFCHAETPRFGVDTRETVTFWRAEGDEPQLCERCHGPDANFHPLGVEPGAERLGTQRPAHLPLGVTGAVRGQVVCTTCHFLHAADADNALLRGLPGAADEFKFRSWQELCRECHGAGLERRSPHAGDERSCAFCHAAKPAPGQPVTLTSQGGRLCQFCHGFKAADHYASVNPYAEPKPCVGCHDPHLGKDHPGRLKKGYFDPIRGEVTLNPHGKRTLCFACHTGDAGPALLTADPVALCQRCHGSGKIAGMSHPLAKVAAGARIPAGWPLSNGALTCLTCHVPGHVEQGRLTKLLREQSADRTAVCFDCHAASQWAGVDPHSEVADEKSGCANCHAGKPSWQDTAAAVTFIADINIVCLSCHDVGGHPGGVAHTVTLKESSRQRVPPELPLAAGSRVTCATCHNPHLNSFSTALLRGVKDPVAFCSRCHSF